MKFKKLTRAGLLVLALGLLLGICLCVSTFDASYAQAPAAAPAAPAAAPADAGPPACSAKVLTECTPSSGDTAWMLTSVALVLDDDHSRDLACSTAGWCARRTSATR